MGCRPSKSTEGTVYPGSGPSAAQHQSLPVTTQTSMPQNSYPPPHPPSQPSQFSFVVRRGSTLYENDRPFRFISINIPNLLLLEDRPDTCGWVIPDPFEQHDALLTVAHMGGRVARTYTLGIGPEYHISGLRTYNEECFVAIDHALAIARNVGVRLIIPLINNHWGHDVVGGGGQDASVCNFGSYAAFSALRNKKPSAFWTDPELVEDFKHLISFLLNRVNTINGIRYGDDPTVLAWQLGNELGGWKGPDPPTSWTLAITAHIRSLAPNTLVMDGTIGGLKSKTKLNREVLSSPTGPDIFANHYYHGGDDVRRLKDDASLTAKYNKAFIIGEFGFSSTEVYARMYENMLVNSNVTGSLMWSLRYHSMFGGFYVHSEEGGRYWSYHAPGFPAKNHGFCFEEYEVMPQLRYYGFRIQGYDPNTVPYPVPQAPSLLPDIAPNWLRWRGSAWAKHYIIWRGTKNDAAPGGVEWEQQPIANAVTDDRCSGSTLYQDETAVEGVGYYYAVQAIGVGGDVSPRSNPVGPVYLCRK